MQVVEPALEEGHGQHGGKDHAGAGEHQRHTGTDVAQAHALDDDAEHAEGPRDREGPHLFCSHDAWRLPSWTACSIRQLCLLLQSEGLQFRGGSVLEVIWV